MEMAEFRPAVSMLLGSFWNPKGGRTRREFSDHLFATVRLEDPGG
jgi:hypothetical protein